MYGIVITEASDMEIFYQSGGDSIAFFKSIRIDKNCGIDSYLIWKHSFIGWKDYFHILTKNIWLFVIHLRAKVVSLNYLVSFN